MATRRGTHAPLAVQVERFIAATGRLTDGEIEQLTPRRLRELVPDEAWRIHPRVRAGLPRKAAIVLLMAEQHRPDAERKSRERTSVDESMMAGTVGQATARFTGDALREQTKDRARRAIEAAGLPFPELDTGSARARYLNERRAADMLDAFGGALEAMLDMAKKPPRDGGPLMAYVAELAPNLEAVRERLDWRARYPEFAQLFAARDLAERLMSPLAPPTPHPSIEPPPWLSNVSRVPPSPRKVIARLRNPPWTHRLAACASVLHGNWPDGVAEDESISPSEVLTLERDAIKKTRSR